MRQFSSMLRRLRPSQLQSPWTPRLSSGQSHFEDARAWRGFFSGDLNRKPTRRPLSGDKDAGKILSFIYRSG